MTEFVDGPQLEVDEHITVNKFEGDLTADEMETAQPIETIKILNGEPMEHIFYEEDGTIKNHIVFKRTDSGEIVGEDIAKEVN
jgi:hypothetical protein